MELKELSIQTHLMGTQVEIKIVEDLPKVDIQNHLEHSINIFHKVIAQLSRFEESSDLSILNKSAGTETVVIQELFDLISLGVNLFKKTNGYFDIAIGGLLEKYGYAQDVNIQNIPSRRLKEFTSNHPSVLDIKFDEDNLTITLPAKMKIDLGSFGKGYAIKLVKEYLLAQNITDFLINAGGDVYANGLNKDRKLWRTLLFDPNKKTQPGERRVLELNNEAIASSGAWGRKYKDFHHLLNPKSGYPHDGETVFVRGKNPMITDLFATIAYLKPEGLGELMEEYGVKAL